MYDLTRFSLDAVNAELNYRHTVDLATASPLPAVRRRVLRRRIIRHGRLRHEDYANGISS
ncbi:MAG TPA: hypothetical protein VFT67_16490 [Jatrophihabitantaceae bacterium]|jgi:hypothetical protein|nr:hypothetical protein [Jatrophihabitantaceae bacterium]